MERIPRRFFVNGVVAMLLIGAYLFLSQLWAGGYSNLEFFKIMASWAVLLGLLICLLWVRDHCLFPKDQNDTKQK